MLKYIIHGADIKSCGTKICKFKFVKNFLRISIYILHILDKNLIAFHFARSVEVWQLSYRIRCLLISELFGFSMKNVGFDSCSPSFLDEIHIRFYFKNSLRFKKFHYLFDSSFAFFFSWSWSRDWAVIHNATIYKKCLYGWTREKVVNCRSAIRHVCVKRFM